MKKSFLQFKKNKSTLIKFGVEVFNLLVENYVQTFFVGGTVRDLILNKKITDIDIATNAKPEQVVKILKENNILSNDSFKNFGVIKAKKGSIELEITTLRKDNYNKSRWPKVSFISSTKEDSKRRDFTINSLYFSIKSGQILDYNKGLIDLSNKQIRFIGTPKKRIKEDPLRIIRALRFCLSLDFNLEKKTKLEIKNNFYLVKNLNKLRIKKEIFKIKNKKQKNILQSVINNPDSLDKYFK